MNKQKLKKILAKLGIFRSGSVSWKGSAKNRSIEFINDSTFKKSDFTTKKDIKEISKKLSKNKKSKLFVGILVFNVILILLLLLSVGFNIGILIATALLLFFRKMFTANKFKSTLALLGGGIAITIVIFLSISIFSNSQNSNDISDTTEKNSSNPKNEIYVIMENIAELTSVEEQIEDKILVKGNDDGTIYLKGKGIAGRDISSDLLRQINPLMQELGFEVLDRGEVGGSQQLGGESYSKGDIFCVVMSGVYAQNFTSPTSSFTFNCAYTKDGASSYMEAIDIQLNY
jgi:hypothetical protein